MSSDAEVWWWRADALCAEMSPEMFFADHPGAAKQVCASCPVRVECLTESLLMQDSYGVFGGFGRTTRRLLAPRIRDGADPRAVAIAAITKETQRGRADPDHRHQPDGGGDRDRLRALAGGRQEERPGLVPRGPRAA